MALLLIVRMDNVHFQWHLRQSNRPPHLLYTWPPPVIMLPIGFCFHSGATGQCGQQSNWKSIAMLPVSQRTSTRDIEVNSRKGNGYCHCSAIIVHFSIRTIGRCCSKEKPESNNRLRACLISFNGEFNALIG